MLTRRQSAIIQLLLSQEDPRSGAELAQALGVTSRTIRSEIRPINDFLNRAGIAASICSSPRRGYWLAGAARADMMHTLISDDDEGRWLPALPEEREIYLCLRLVSTDDYLTMEELASELLASKTTVSKDVRTIAKFIKRLEGVSLEVSHSRGIRLSGSEEHVRSFIAGFTLYYQTQFGHSLRRAIDRLYPSQGKLDRLYYDLVDALLAQDIVITGPSMEMLAIEYFLMIQRQLAGHIATKTPSAPYKEVALPLPKIEQLFGISICETERIIMLQLLARKRFLTSPIVRERRTMSIQIITQRFLEEVRTRYGFDFTGNDAVREHVAAMITYHHLTFKRSTELVPEIQENYPFAYEIACLIIPLAEEVHGYHLQESEVCRLATRLVVAMDAIPQQWRTIVVVESASYAELLQFKLNSYFNKKLVIVGTYPLYQLNDALMRESDAVDLILTTRSLPPKSDIPVLRISPILSNKDISLINDFLFRNNRSYRPK